MSSGNNIEDVTFVGRDVTPAVENPEHIWFKDKKVISSINNNNVIAFTSHSSMVKSSKTRSFRVRLYVADLNMPMEPFLVAKLSNEVTVLSWSSSGDKLMVGDIEGGIQIWEMIDYMISKWKMKEEHHPMNGERILVGFWFHTGSRPRLLPQHKEVNKTYDERFAISGSISQKFGPTLSVFGGKSCDGFIAISGSGMVFALVTLSDSATTNATSPLSKFRTPLSAVDVSYARNGHFLVVTSDGSVESSINCYQLSIKVSLNPTKEISECTISCMSFYSFYLKNPIPVDPSSQVTHLKFLLEEGGDGVIVATSSSTGSTIELWELAEMPRTVHRMFQKTRAEDTKRMECVWMHRKSESYTSQVSCISTMKYAMYEQAGPSYVVVGYDDNTIKFLYREMLQEITQRKVGLTKTHSIKTESNLSAKPLVTSLCTITDMQFTQNGCALIAMNRFSEMMIYRMPPILDGATQGTSYNPIILMQTFLEYCVVSGNDWWDVVLGLRNQPFTVIDGLCEALTMAFNKNNSHTQKRFYIRFQQLKIYLYRCLPCCSDNHLAQAKLGDLMCSLQITTSAQFLKSQIRARKSQDSMSGDVFDILTKLIGTKSKDYCNILTLIKEIAPNTYFVDPSVLKTVSSLTQFVADVTLFLLSALPDLLIHKVRYPGTILMNDVTIVNTLRELLVLAQIWDYTNDSILNFHRFYGDIPIVPHVYKLLTQRFLLLGTSEVDETLIDECSKLPTIVYVDSLDYLLKQKEMPSPTMFTKLKEINYFNKPYGEKQITIHRVESTHDYTTYRNTDLIRHKPIGKDSLMRRCTRCYGMSHIRDTVRPSIICAFSNRFSTTCLCGGFWS